MSIISNVRSSRNPEIWQEHFGLKPVNQNLPSYGIYTGKQKTAIYTNLGYFQRKIKRKKFWKVKKQYLEPFWALFANVRANWSFSEKLGSVTFPVSRFLFLHRISAKSYEFISWKLFIPSTSFLHFHSFL